MKTMKWVVVRTDDVNSIDGRRVDSTHERRADAWARARVLRDRGGSVRTVRLTQAQIDSM